MRTNRLLWALTVVLALLALAVLSVAAQGNAAEPAPATTQKGESASPTANLIESEPNNGFATANVLRPGDVIAGRIGYAGDVDTFRIALGDTDEWNSFLIDIDAASQGSPLNAFICIYQRDMNGPYLLACNDDSDGWDSLLHGSFYSGDVYYIQVSNLDNDKGGRAYTYKLALYSPLFVSAPVAGTVGGIPFGPEDVLAHYDFADGTEKWLMFFDGSDLGITQNVNSLALDNYDQFGFPHLALTFERPQDIEGLGMVRPNDAVVFIPEQLGPDTAGDSWYNLGLYELDAAGEKVDALGYGGLDSGYFAISTAGTATVTSWWVDGPPWILRARDEDLFEGEITYGTMDSWGLLVFDGSNVPGLAVEDVFAADLGAHWTWYLTILGTGLIDGHAYSQMDIFMVDGETYEVLGRYWHGPDHHFNYKLDASDIDD